jgi:gliding motility-associated-like protein
MKGFLLKTVFTGIIFLFSQQFSKAQCPFDNFNTGDLTPPGVGMTSSTTGGGGDGWSVTVCAGAQYTATTCGTSAFDTHMTVFDAAGNVIGFNDDACGAQSTVTWTSTYTGTAWVFLDRWVSNGNDCSHTGTGQPISVTQNTACAATIPPSNCGSPTAVACGTALTNQTTLGGVNDVNTMSCHVDGASVPIPMPGADRFYAVTVGAGITTIVVTMNNVVDGNDSYVELLYLGSACNTTNCSTSEQYDIANGTFLNGTNTAIFSAVGPGTFYFVVDAQSSDGIYLYDISFDCFASGISLDDDGCAVSGGFNDANDGDINGLVPTVNGSQTILTMSACETYTVCHTFFIENTTNWEWLDHIQFNLGSCFTNITSVTNNAAGMWQAGNWVSTVGAGTIDWEFNHNAPNTAWGDGSGGSYNCQRSRQFCFNTIIDPGCTNGLDMTIGIILTDDGIGGSGATVVGTTVGASDNFVMGTLAPTANAGVDDATCATTPYVLSGSITAPAVSSTWTTSGTGTFSNAASLTSSYTPSVADVLAGSVTLTLTTNDPAGSCGPGTDAMVLTFDIPAVISAGADQLACNMNPINLAGTSTGAVVTTTWTTSGSGTFSDATSLTSTYTPSAADEIAGSVTLTLTSSDPVGMCGPVTDQMVITFDNTAPTLTCPANQSSTTSAGTCTRSLAIPNPTVSDNCSYTLSWASVGATVLSGAGNVGTQTFNLGVTTITYTAVDPFGNTSTCSFTVTITDNINPTITCPVAQTLNLNASCQASLPNYTGLATAADNCSVTVTQSPVAGTLVSGTGTTVVTLTATDGAGNTATCSFNVNRVDVTNPTITCPAAQTLNLNASCQASLPNYTGLATATDNCSVTVTQSPAVGTLVSGTGTTVVTLTATDGAGNTATCSFNVNRVDVTNPTITCPAAQTLNLNASCQASLPDYTGLATAADNCSVTVTQSPVVGTLVSGTGTTVVTLTATDGSGNTATCSFNVNRVDVTNPTITCPVAQTLNLNASCQASLPDYTGLATAADNCSVTVTQSPVIGTLVTGTGTTVVTLTATDGAGNTATCSFNVNRVDVTNPTITCPAAQTLNLNASCQASLPNYTGLATAADNCSVSVTQSPAVGTLVSGTGTTVVTLTATDGSGNTATCSFNVNRVDVTAPTVTCPANQTATANASCQFVMSDYTSLVTTSDNCSVVTVTQSPASGTTVSGTQTVTMTGTDASGNTATCTFQVTVIDNTPPTITCPAAQTGNVNASCQFSIPDYTGLATSTDNCTAVPTITQSPVVGALVGVGTTVVTLTATDANGNSSTCTFNVVVTDITAPTVTCPAAQTLNLDASCAGTLSNYIPLVTATDNCGIATVTQSPVSGTAVSGVGTTVITITATDINGNVSTCTFNVNRVDNTAPSITCPGNQTAAADAACQFTMIDYTGLATSSDNCSAVTVTQSPVAGTLVSGTQTVTMTGTDASGNTSTCTFQVVVTDNTNPVITSACPTDQTVNADASCGYTLPNFTATLTATDNCTAAGSLTITQNPAAGSVIGLGVTPIVVTVSDANGNSATCNFDITVIDNTVPTIVNCPANQNLTIAANCDVALPDFTSTLNVTDNCSPAGTITITQSPVAGTILSGNGTVQTVTLTVTDAVGNVSTCTFDVTVVDGVNPTFVSCTPNQNEIPDASCQFTLPDYTSLATVSDNCSIVSNIVVTQSPAVGSVISGTSNITLTATDEAGNTATCVFQVILSDGTPPTITSGCPANQTVNADATCGYTMTDFTGSITVTDNCNLAASITITQSPAVGATLPLGVTTVTLTATDMNGNASNCTFDITVIDNTVPTIVNCPANQNLTIAANCDAALPDFTSTLNVTDNCSPAGTITITQSPVAGTILSGNGTVQTVTLTVTDAVGNASTCTFDVTVVDGVNPTFVSCTPNQNEIPDASCQFTLPDYTSLATVSDNCSIVSNIVVTQSPAVGSVISGTSNITLTATDEAGNTATCVFQVILSDGTPPTITSGCPANQTVNADATCGYTMTDFTGSITVTDNCNLAASITITQSPAVGATLPLGVTTVTLTATDMNGNASNCTFDITVIDNTVPTIVNCPANQNLTIAANCDVALPDFTSTLNVTDNCSPAGTITITQSPVAGTILSGNGTVQTVTLTVTDAVGNASTCTFDVTVVDGVAPTFVTCTPNQNEIPDANCQFTLPDYTSLSSTTDNCVTSTVTVTQSPAVGTVITGTTTITLTATDQDGNAATCTFDVILQDGTPPVITSGCPANQNVNADASCGYSLTDFTGSITVTDNCNLSSSVIITQSPIAGTSLAVGTTTVTLTATDLNGNASTCTFDVVVTDATAPTITCPANIISCDPVVTFVAPNGADNCSGSTTVQTDGTGLSSGSTFPMGTTTLTYTVTDAAGNNVSCSFDVTVVDITVSPNAGADVSYCNTDIISPLTGVAASGGNLTWYSDPALTSVLGTGSSYTPSNNTGTTVYYLSEDVSGCNSNPDSVSVTITVCDTITLEIPTGFTPDGDGTNDVWDIPGLNTLYPENTVQVYGRWGGLLFESPDHYATTWDGTYKGKELPVGSYYFVIDLGDGSDPIKGTVTIIE